MTPEQRVVARFRSAAVVDPKQSLEQVRARLRVLEEMESEAFDVQASGYTVQDFYSSGGDLEHKKAIRDKFLRIGTGLVNKIAAFYELYNICLALLQSYELTPTQRRKVESIAKFWAAKHKARAIPAAKLLDTYFKMLETIRAHYAALEAIVSSSPLLDEGSKIQAGSFNLVNTGGFDAKVMADTAALVAKGEQLVKAKGFGKICYGDVHITRQISKQRTLAFYQIKSDEMFVRAGVRLNVDSLHVFIHELGHRLQLRFLPPSKTAELKELYQKHKRQSRGIQDQVVFPEIGEEVPYRGKVLQVVKLEPARSRIVLKLKGDESNAVYTIPLQKWKSPSQPDPGPKAGGFVTPYAGTDPEENFAELFAFYCLGRLSPEHVADLEAIL